MGKVITWCFSLKNKWYKHWLSLNMLRFNTDLLFSIGAFTLACKQFWEDQATSRHSSLCYLWGSSKSLGKLTLPNQNLQRWSSQRRKESAWLWTEVLRLKTTESWKLSSNEVSIGLHKPMDSVDLASFQS